MIEVMRSAWRRISATGAAAPIERRILAQGLEISGDHRERRTQLVRGIGDEILTHGFEPHLSRHVAHQQEQLAVAIGRKL